MFSGAVLNWLLPLGEGLVVTCYSGIITIARQLVGNRPIEDSDGTRDLNERLKI